MRIVDPMSKEIMCFVGAHFSALDHANWQILVHVSELMTPFERSLSKLSENQKLDLQNSRIYGIMQLEEIY